MAKKTNKEGVVNGGSVEETVNSEQPTVVQEQKKEDDSVTISKKDFNEWMQKMEKQSKDIELLYKAADKNRMAKAKGENNESLIKQAKVSTWDDTGKIIVGWKLITNRCEVVLGRWQEEQTVTAVFEDGETITVPLLEFYRKTLHKMVGDIVSRTDEYDSQNNKIEILKIEFPNGKKVKINSTFLN